MERTVEYLNATMSRARFYAVELVRFAADGHSAFESRTVLKPASQRSASPREVTDETQFLEQIDDDAYGEALQEVLEGCRGLSLRFSWGTARTSIRLLSTHQSKPLSIAWLFPPGVSGWMGLTDLTLGFDTGAVEQVPSMIPALEDYVERVAALPGVEFAKPDWTSGYRLDPERVVRHRHEVADILAELVRRVGEVV